MDTGPYRWACRFVCYTLAMTATLAAPAALQAAILWTPDMLAAGQAGAAMSCVIAASIVAFPALLRGLVTPVR